MGTLVRRNLARVQANRASTASALHSFSLPRLLASRNGRLFDDLAGLLPPQEKFYRTFFDKPRADNVLHGRSFKPNYNDTYSKSKYAVLRNMNDTLPNKTSNAKAGVDPYLELLQVSSGWWVEDETSSTIHDISLKVESNMLLIVTGPVGSGKSTLLMTMLSEIPVKSGHISSSGKMAYVSQIPWIFTGTVRENIIFGKPFDQTKYEKVLEVCDLNRDIHEFPKGDLCVIGQRGVMLSGGQRVRVSLARAVYSDADIFLLDDPLSAVDAKVGQHIFDKCICGELSRKIRILVTHQLQHLHRADEIVVLKEGSILRRGSFGELREDENVEHMFANHGRNETSDSKEDRNDVPVIKDEKEKDRSRLDLVQEDEDKAIGTVSWRLYWDYFRSGLPSVLVVGLFLFFAAAQAFPIIPTWWLKVMTKMAYEKQKSATVLGIYGGLVGGSFIVAAISTILMFAALLRSSEKLHDKMTLAVLKSPVLFFDTNPVGRIMNRFSKDIGAMDDLLPISFIIMTMNFIYFFGVLVLTGIVNYWLTIAVIPTLAVFFLLCRYYLKPARDLSRLEAMLRSPVYAHISETMEGLEVIHSLQMEDRNVEKLYK
ncbi:hypothetical protein QZH41_002858 [Actinostola sp. cb2023]|nr:hypothetical protein QZH41_002858 [Actinostola sp. cb2023]